jgi:hypothetical protein
MAWVLLLIFLYMALTRIFRNREMAVKTALLIPVVFILYLATVSPDLARFVATIIGPLFLLALFRVRSRRRRKR